LLRTEWQAHSYPRSYLRTCHRIPALVVISCSGRDTRNKLRCDTALQRSPIVSPDDFLRCCKKTDDWSLPVLSARGSKGARNRPFRGTEVTSPRLIRRHVTHTHPPLVPPNGEQDGQLWRAEQLDRAFGKVEHEPEHCEPISPQQ